MDVSFLAGVEMDSEEESGASRIINHGEEMMGELRLLGDEMKRDK
jgi:hypothetical protein